MHAFKVFKRSEASLPVNARPATGLVFLFLQLSSFFFFGNSQIIFIGNNAFADFCFRVFSCTSCHPSAFFCSCPIFTKALRVFSARDFVCDRPVDALGYAVGNGDDAGAGGGESVDDVAAFYGGGADVDGDGECYAGAVGSAAGAGISGGAIYFQHVSNRVFVGIAVFVPHTHDVCAAGDEFL